MAGQIVGKRHVQGWLASADISTAGEIVLTDESGNTVTLGADDRLVVHSMHASLNPAAGDSILTIFSDDDDDNAIDSGEERFAFIATANAVTNSDWTAGGRGKIFGWGGKPHAIGSSAGVCRISLTGTVETRNP